MVTPTNQPTNRANIEQSEAEICNRKGGEKNERRAGSFSQSKRAAIKLCSSIQSKRCPATSIARAWNWKPKREIIMYNLVQFCAILYNFAHFCAILYNFVQFCAIWLQLISGITKTDATLREQNINSFSDIVNIYCTGAFTEKWTMPKWFSFQKDQRYGQINILFGERFWEDGFVEVNYHLFYIHRILGELTLGSAQGKLFDPRKKLAFWNSVPDNTLGARNYSCCSWNSVRAVPRVTSLWWPPGPRAVSKLLNWWYMQQHNLRELAVFSQNVFFQLSKYLPISRKTRMMFMTSKCNQVSCFLTDLYDRGRM